MDTIITDVVIHVDEALSREERLKLENTVREDSCVISVGVPPGKEHLMQVAYNRDCTTAKDIVERINKQGIHAEVVG